MKTKFGVLVMLFSLLIISCTKEDTEKSTITAEEATVSAKLDLMNDDVSKIVEEQEMSTYTNATSGKMTTVADYYLPNCAQVTRVPAFGTLITPGTVVTKTIDFGTIGCPLPNGIVVKGKIIIVFTFQPEATSHTINYTFDNFYHNNIKYTGTKTFTRVMSTSESNPNIHPIVTMNMDMTATFPNGNVYTRVGQRVREIVEGYTTPIWTDNVYKVTGSWTTTFPNAATQTATITTPIMIKLNCAYISKGVITIVRDATTATLDYGNGECDNQAVFTINGVSYPITLGGN